MLWRQAILRANFTKKLQDKEAMCEQLIKTLQQYEGEMRSNGMQVSARSEEFIQQKNSSDAAFDTPVTSRGSNAAVEKEIAMLRKESKRLEEENKRLLEQLEAEPRLDSVSHCKTNTDFRKPYNHDNIGYLKMM